MTKKTFLVEHDATMGSILVAIDFDFKNDYGEGPVSMEDIIKDMAMFWATSDNRLTENSGSHLNTFLKLLCEQCLTHAHIQGLNVEGVIELFDNVEGWSKMDGSQGIELIRVDLMDLSNQEDYSIREITLPKKNENPTN